MAIAIENIGMIVVNNKCVNNIMSNIQQLWSRPDLYAFIGFIGPDDINDMCWTFSDNMCYILVIKYQY